MPFANPLLLWGLGLVSVPIIIHLLNRRKFQVVKWAAMEFLLQANRRNRRRIRLEHLLVLLLRCLAMAFLTGRLVAGGAEASTRDSLLEANRAGIGARTNAQRFIAPVPHQSRARGLPPDSGAGSAAHRLCHIRDEE